MNSIKMAVNGAESNGWIWSFWIDDLELYRMMPLSRFDIGATLFEFQRDRSRKNPFFYDLSDDEVFFLLDGFFFGGFHDALHASAEQQTWARHLVTPEIVGEVESRMYLVGCKNETERLLVWQNGRRLNFILPEGEFDRQLKEIVERLE